MGNCVALPADCSGTRGSLHVSTGARPRDNTTSCRRENEEKAESSEGHYTSSWVKGAKKVPRHYTFVLPAEIGIKSYELSSATDPVSETSCFVVI
jgi:hypothetical protein